MLSSKTEARRRPYELICFGFSVKIVNFLKSFGYFTKVLITFPAFYGSVHTFHTERKATSLP